MHHIALAAAILFFVSAQVCALSATLQQLELRCEVNDRLPEAEKFEPVWWHIGTYEEFYKLRLRVLPESHRPRLIQRFSLTGAGLFFASVTAFFLSANV